MNKASVWLFSSCVLSSFSYSLISKLEFYKIYNIRQIWKRLNQENKLFRETIKRLQQRKKGNWFPITYLFSHKIHYHEGLNQRDFIGTFKIVSCMPSRTFTNLHEGLNQRDFSGTFKIVSCMLPSIIGISFFNK